MVIDPATLLGDAPDGAHVLQRLQALQHHVLTTDPRSPAATTGGEEPRPAWPLVRQRMGRWLALQWRGQWSLELVDVVEGELVLPPDWLLLDGHPGLPPVLQLWRLDRQLGEPLDASLPERLGWVNRIGLWLARPDDLARWVLTPQRRWAIRHQMAGGRPRRAQVGVAIPAEIRLADDLILWGDEILARSAADRLAWWAHCVRSRLGPEGGEQLLRTQQWTMALLAPLWDRSWPDVPHLLPAVPPVPDPRDPELGGPDVDLLHAHPGWARLGEHGWVQRWLQRLETGDLEAAEQVWPWLESWLLDPEQSHGGPLRRLAVLRRQLERAMGPVPDGPGQQRYFLEERHRRDGELVREGIAKFVPQSLLSEAQLQPLLQPLLRADGEAGKPWRLLGLQLMGRSAEAAAVEDATQPRLGGVAPSVVGGNRTRTAWDLPI